MSSIECIQCMDPFEEGPEAADLLQAAMDVRDGLGAGTIKFDLGQDESFARQAAYLDALNSLPFTKYIAARTRGIMGVKPGGTYFDVGCGLFSDVVEMDADMQGQGTIVGIDLKKDFLDEAAEKHQAANCGTSFCLKEADARKLSSLGLGKADGIREIRTAQQAENPEIIFAQMVAAANPGAAIVSVTPNWEALTIHGYKIDQDVLSVVSAYSDSGKLFGVVNPGLAKFTARFLKAAGAVCVRQEEHLLVSSDFNRANMAIRMTHKLPELVEKGALTQGAADVFEQTVRNEMAARRAELVFPYVLSYGHAPQ